MVHQPEVTDADPSLKVKIIFVVQVFLISILKIPVYLYGYRHIRVDKTQAGSKLVILNHVSEVDIFISVTALSYDTHRKVGPYRVLTKNKYIDIPVVGQLLRLVGSFPAFDHHKHESGIKHSVHLLNSGQSVMIFPQGKLYRYKDFEKSKHGRLRTGAKVISEKQRVMPVLQRKVGFKKYVIQGKDFDATDMDIHQMMEKVWELEKHIPKKNKRKPKN